ncbi:MAG TPA: PQQ-binding-like beta-propeller repeat protein [Vicinamibacterales bacterium]|nr:PQQ-binding-like beta-propeller repeat protein [Vicinamibacterales bacterium]
MRLLSAAFVAAAVSSIAAPALAQAQASSGAGEAVYKQSCAACHEGNLPRMPNRAALRELTPEHVETALSSFSMRRQGANLTPAERRAVAEFVTGRPSGSYRAPLEIIPKSAYCAAGVSSAAAPFAGASWNGWGVDSRNTRFQPASAAGLAAADVPKLKLKWAFGVPGVSASGSQVSVVGSRVFVGARNGMVYSLDAKTGCLVWAYEASAAVRSTPLVVTGTAGDTIYFGDAHAQVYALDAKTGALKWKTKAEDHLDAIITGGVSYANGRVFVPVASMEESSGALPTYQCCTFRGSVLALDAASGKQIWKTYTIPEEPQQTTRSSRGVQLFGPSGAGVWGAPALDAARNRVYVATGDAYSQPAAPSTDAIMALAMDTGKIIWVRQTLAGDAWNVACLGPKTAGVENCPAKAGPDYDFGAATALVTAGGRRLVIAGQKSGELYAVNADSGEMVWKTRAGDGGVLGGIEWGFATDGTSAFVSLSSAFEKKPGEAGGVVSVNLADGKPRWTAPPSADTCAGRAGCNTGQPAAVSAMPGVIFSGALDGHLRAYDSSTGKVIWDVDTARAYDTTVNGVPAKGGGMNGPGATVAGGMLFVNSGYGSIGFMPGNAILAFSVDGK